MKLSTENLILSPDAVVDLQLHTMHSDGKWTPEDLIDYLIGEGFGLAAITDHDRADMAAEFQKIASEKNFPLLVAVEVSSTWKGNLTDFLCYGFDPEDNALLALTKDVAQRQKALTTTVINNLRNDDYPITNEELEAILAKPPAQHVPELIDLMQKHQKEGEPIGKTLLGAGFDYVTVEPAAIVKAAHDSDAICILAHPGRDDGFTCYDGSLLDELREETPIDGIEPYYPKHSEEQTKMYLDYAEKHDLLVSSGSDSHDDKRQLPIKYKAGNIRKLLERLGIVFS